MTKNEMQRVNINLPVHIVEKVKNYADTLGINYTSAYIVLLNQALEQKDTIGNLPTLVSMFEELKKISPQINDKTKLISDSLKK